MAEMRKNSEQAEFLRSRLFEYNKLTLKSLVNFGNGALDFWRGEKENFIYFIYVENN